MSLQHKFAPMDLVELARDKSKNGRMRLVEALVEQYLQPGQPLTVGESEQFSLFIDDLYRGTVPMEVRQLLAERAVESDHIPSSLARKLVMDEIEVAYPLLISSPALSEQDLLDVIGLKKIPHQIAIAGRASVSEAVADALVTTGSVEVIETLLKNFGAKLSRASIDNCVELARRVQTLRVPLIHRDELTAQDASKLMWWLPRELRQVITQRFGSVEGSTDGRSTSNNIEDMLARYQTQTPTLREAEFFTAWLADRDAVNPQLLVQVLRMRSAPLFTTVLARILRLPVPLVQKCISDKKGQLLAVLCRAIGMEKSHFASSFMLLIANDGDGKPLAPSVLEEALMAFDRVTEMRAVMMIRAWRENPELLKSRI